jgi:hypothetical protein
MGKSLTALVAATVLYTLSSSASGMNMGIDGIHPEGWTPPKDKVEQIGGVERRTTWSPFVSNPDCPFEYVPAFSYIQVAKSGEHLDTVLLRFAIAGVPSGVLNNAHNEWSAYDHKKFEIPLVFSLGHAGSCYTDNKK